MNDYFTRLAARARNAVPTVQPRFRPRFGPGPDMPPADEPAALPPPRKRQLALPEADVTAEDEEEEGAEAGPNPDPFLSIARAVAPKLFEPGVLDQQARRLPAPRTSLAAYAALRRGAGR